MRPMSFALPLALLAGLGSAAPVCAADLAVTLTDVRATTGIMMIALVDSAEAFDGKARPVRTAGGTPEGATHAVRFEGLAPGRYAVMVTHDENGNGRLDMNAMGMPLEGYGFSNNPQVMRKPTWDEAAFEVGADAAAITIELR